jgi:xanthine dehydrogenase accessory factor
MEHPERAFRFLSGRISAGEGAALVTVIAVTGASVRNPGAHMAVAAGGDYVGSLSGGCIEAAIVAEARQAIADGSPRLLHYGAGSSQIDIRLPCGGAVHLLVTPLPDSGWIDVALDAFARREKARFSLLLPTGEAIDLVHAPPLRVAVLGFGAATSALARLVLAMGADLALWSPDSAICAEFPGRSNQLRTPRDRLDFTGDQATAIAMLFHDHEWEPQLLAGLLAEPSLMVGAMGSRATHAARVDRLAALGVSANDIARIRSPIGLIHSSRDPESLALSAFVEMVDAYNRAQPFRLFKRPAQDRKGGTPGSHLAQAR